MAAQAGPARHAQDDERGKPEHADEPGPPEHAPAHGAEGKPEPEDDEG